MPYSDMPDWIANNFSVRIVNVMRMELGRNITPEQAREWLDSGAAMRSPNFGKRSYAELREWLNDYFSGPSQY